MNMVLFEFLQWYCLIDMNPVTVKNKKGVVNKVELGIMLKAGMLLDLFWSGGGVFYFFF